MDIHTQVQYYVIQKTPLFNIIVILYRVNKSFPIQLGMALRAEFEVPRDCSSDHMCEFLRLLPDGTKFVVEGRIDSAAQFSLTAEVDFAGKEEGLAIGKNMILKNIFLGLEVGTTVGAKFEVGGKMSFKVQEGNFIDVEGKSFKCQ